MDHYFKIFFHKIYKEIVFYTGVIFMDKFVINKLVNNYFIAVSAINEKIINFKNKNNLNNIKKLIFIILIIFILLIFYFF